MATKQFHELATEILMEKICTSWLRVGFFLKKNHDPQWYGTLKQCCSFMGYFSLCIISVSSLHIFFFLECVLYYNIFCLKQWPLLQSNVAFLISDFQGVFKNRVENPWVCPSELQQHLATWICRYKLHSAMLIFSFISCLEHCLLLIKRIGLED